LPTSQFSLNTFRPSSTTQDGGTTERGLVLAPLSLDFRIFFQFDDDPLTIQQQVDGEYEQTKVVVQRQWAMHLGVAMGLWRYAQLAVQLPVYLSTGLPGEKGGLGDLALVPKAAHRFDLPSLPKGLGLGLAMPLAFPTGRTHALTSTGSVTVSPLLALDIAAGRFLGALNLGALLRRSDDGVPRRGSALLVNALLGFDFIDGTLGGLVELSSSMDTSDLSARGAIALVAQAGLRYRHRVGLCLGALLGAGLTPGIGSPDARLLLEIGWTLPSLHKEKDAAQPFAQSKSLDADLDGIEEPSDKCPTAAEDFDGLEDDDGCPEEDNDGDGILDAKDKCPNDAENSKGAKGADGCPEEDGDFDGVSDHSDDCPNEAEDRDTFEDDDGCPDRDNDLDGLADTEDKCPMLPGSPDAKNGCPMGYSFENDLLVPKRPLRFEKDTIRLVDPGYDSLEQIAAAIIANPQWSVRVEVHENGAGNAASKLSLSQARADTLKRLLILAGIIAERVTAIGLGNKAPIAPTDTPQGRRLNERVIIRVALSGNAALRGGTP
jgi:outer membrane protein OmpA-like peptidoglycan-associated protein